MQLFKSYSLVVLTIFFALGCTQQQSNENMKETMAAGSDTATTAAPSSDFSKAVAVVHPTESNEISGSVTFTKEDKGVRVQGEFEDLSQGKHGFHIHEYGDCRAADGTSAGGHYNPTDNQHGAPSDKDRHMGDMGNLEVREDGAGSINYVDTTITLNGANSIIGRGIVIHGGEDDLKSQPSGAAGPRVGCGVIGVANTEMDSTAQQ